MTLSGFQIEIIRWALFAKVKGIRTSLIRVN
jgi:hypothetical protein